MAKPTLITSFCRAFVNSMDGVGKILWGQPSCFLIRYRFIIISSSIFVCCWFKRSSFIQRDHNKYQKKLVFINHIDLLLLFVGFVIHYYSLISYPSHSNKRNTIKIRPIFMSSTWSINTWMGCSWCEVKERKILRYIQLQSQKIIF